MKRDYVLIKMDYNYNTSINKVDGGRNAADSTALGHYQTSEKHELGLKTFFKSELRDLRAGKSSGPLRQKK